MSWAGAGAECVGVAAARPTRRPQSSRANAAHTAPPHLPHPVPHPPPQVQHRRAVHHHWQAQHRRQRRRQRWSVRVSLSLGLGVCICVSLGVCVSWWRPLGEGLGWGRRRLAPGVWPPPPCCSSALACLPTLLLAAWYRCLTRRRPSPARQVAAFEGPPAAAGAPRPEALGTFSAGSCADVPPPGPYTCAQQAGWGRCNDQYYKQNKFCAVTCGFCGSGGGGGGGGGSGGGSSPAPPVAASGGSRKMMRLRQ